MPILLMHLLTIFWVQDWDTEKIFQEKIRAEIFAGADNIFDTKYSLGNDINAAVGRYYNAAPGRNYYAGIIFQFNQR